MATPVEREAAELEATNVAILLCAGYGTRMGGDIPKPLLEAAGRPVLDHTLDQIESLPDLDTVHVVSNSRHADHYSRWIDTQRRTRRSLRGGRVQMMLHDDGSTSNDDRLGAIGDLAFVLERIAHPSGALVSAGDNILRFALGPFWQSFLASRATTVLALHETDPQRLQDTAALELSAHRVVRLAEKPAACDWKISPSTSWGCPACYALDAGALASVTSYLSTGGSRDEIGRFIGHLVATRDVRGFRLRGERLHVGNRAELERANQLLAGENVVISDGREVT